MDITGQYIITATPTAIWKAILTPAILQQAIPTCKELTKVSDTEFRALLKPRIGPFKPSFNACLFIENPNPPYTYDLRGEGQGGIAGFGTGTAHVTMEARPDNTTLLTYDASASANGKVASLGASLIKGSITRLLDKFFDDFATAMDATSRPVNRAP